MLCPIFRNPSATPPGANKVSRDPSQRIQNLNVLIQQIKTYYLVSFVSQTYDMLYNVSKLPAVKLSIHLSTSDYDIRTFCLGFSTLLQFVSSITHTLDHTCAN